MIQIEEKEFKKILSAALTYESLQKGNIQEWKSYGYLLAETLRLNNCDTWDEYTEKVLSKYQ